jgi:penicillin-binding protein 1A
MSPDQRRRPPAPPPHGRKRRKSRKERAKRRRRHALWIAGALGGIAAAIVVATLGGAVAVGASCSLRQLKPAQIGENTFVYAADGSLLGVIPAERNRQRVRLRDTSPWVRKATIAIEDRRYYEHGGVDYAGIARALWRDVNAGRVVEGGSTIPQQLVRNLYISRERTIQRKVKEACLAIKLSRAWRKDRILQEYLNTVYYGNHAYGVEAAAQTYFSKRARSLSLVDSALLAGLPQLPSTYDPTQNPDAALARRDEVLRAMRKTGVITEQQFESAMADRSLHLRAGKLYQTIREPYFFGFVIEELRREYGAETVRSGGLAVYTTIDRRLQRLAERAIRDTLSDRNDPAAAIVAIDPRSGAIRAMTSLIPGRRSNQFNLASQAQRQAGSTFKTFVLTAALEAGMDPDHTYYTSAPYTCTDGRWCSPEWKVKTYDNSYVGGTSVSSATLRSDNSVYAQLTMDVGPDRVRATAQKLGVDLGRQRTVASIGLGALAVSPLSMGTGYATIAAGGIYSRPTAIRKVVLANGREDVDAGWGKPERKRVISEGVAWKVTSILEQNVRYGTGTAAGFGRPAAGKTGTTDNHADAWFCGFMPELATTVWMGYSGGEIPMENVHGISVSGGSFPAQIWRRFMEPAVEGRPERDFPEPRHYPVYRYFKKGDHGYLAYIPSPPSAPEKDEKKDAGTADKTKPKPANAPAAIPNPRAEPPVSPRKRDSEP